MGGSHMQRLFAFVAFPVNLCTCLQQNLNDLSIFLYACAMKWSIVTPAILIALRIAFLVQQCLQRFWTTQAYRQI